MQFFSFSRKGEEKVQKLGDEETRYLLGCVPFQNTGFVSMTENYEKQ